MATLNIVQFAGVVGGSIAAQDNEDGASPALTGRGF